MADLRYIIETTTSTAERNVSNLENRVTSLDNAFSRLGAAIAAVGLGAMIRSAAQMANSIQDLSATTGVTTESIIALSKAFSENSGSASGARSAIDRFNKTIGDALTGSKSAGNAFALLGITLNDLRNNSADQVLNSVISGLSAIENQSIRSSIAVGLFAESASAVDFSGVGAGFEQSLEAGNRYASAVQAAGAANQQLSNAINNLQLELLRVIEPISKFIASIEPGTIEKFVEALGALVKVLGALGAALLITRTLQGLAKIILTVLANSAKLKAIIVGLLTPLASMKGVLAASTLSFTSIGTVIAALAGKLFAFAPIIGGVAVAFYALSEAVRLFTGQSLWERMFGGANEAGKEVQKTFDEVQKSIKDAFGQEVQNSIRAVQQYIDGINLSSLRRELEILKTVAPENRNLARTLTTAADEYAKQVRDLYAVLEQMDAADSNAWMTTEYQQIAQEITRLNTAYVEQINLIKQIESVRREELRQTELQIQAAQRLAREESLLALFNEQSSRQQLERDRAVLRLKEQLNQIISEGTTAVSRYSVELEKLSLGTLDRELIDITNSQRAATEQARALVNSLREANLITLEQSIAEIQKLEEAERRVIEQRQAGARELYEQQRAFSTGWSQALTAYNENAFNAAEAARSVFATATRGMEEALTRFVTTGKLSFRSLIQDMITQLLKLQMQKAVIGLISGLTGGLSGNPFASLAGVGDSLGPAFAGGFSTGGFIPAGKFGLVGENGPEFITGPANITPMSQQPVNTSVNYNIQAVDARSFKDLVASDPAFLFAVTEKGRQTLPARRR